MKLLLLPLAALLLLTPEIAAAGVRAGIDLCLQTVIPSLFIFMILCQWIAEKVELGFLPDDMTILSGLIYRMCYENAKKNI